MGLSLPPSSVSSKAVSPVGLKPHFSITRPEAGLSVKCPLMSEGRSVCRLTRSTIHANASVQ